MLDTELLYRRVGEGIRQFREAQTPRMSQGELAKVLGLKRTSVTNIESGYQKPSLDTLYRLCEHFGIEINELIPAVREVSRTEARSIEVGGRTQELPPKTADLVDRIRPASRTSR